MACASTFCATLPTDVRDVLCRHCTKTTFAKNSAIALDVEHPWLVLEGVLCGFVRKKPTSLMVPGDFLLTPVFGKDSAYVRMVSEEEHGSNDATYYLCVTPVAVATFPNSIIQELIDDIRFCKPLFYSTLELMSKAARYSMFLYHFSAYDAVRHVAILAKAYGFDPLTHEQIALISGRNRVTVTRIMHELALAEPNLVQETS